jgi:hypothetical protein
MGFIFTLPRSAPTTGKTVGRPKEKVREQRGLFLRGTYSTATRYAFSNGLVAIPLLFTRAQPVYLVIRLCTISAALSGAFISSISILLYSPKTLIGLVG